MVQGLLLYDVAFFRKVLSEEIAVGRVDNDENNLDLEGGE